MQIAIINESTLVNTVDMKKMVGAIQKQMTWHVAPAWNEKAPSIKFYTDKTKIPATSWVVNMLDNSTEAGALGYHSEDSGLIDAFIFAKPVLDNGGVVLHDPKNNQNVSVASVLSHEVCEMFGDPVANFWADGPAITQGNEYALELCDPVENDSYDIALTDGSLVSVSNFILPAWFDPQAKLNSEPFDYLKKLSKPFSMTKGGYMIVRKAGREAQVFGEHMPAWRQEIKNSTFYRR